MGINTHLTNFLNAFNKEADLVEKLLIIYDFVDECPNGEFRLKFCKSLMNHFIKNMPTSNSTAINVFKTLEISCRGFKDNPITQEEYKKVVELYNNTKKNLPNQWVKRKK